MLIFLVSVLAPPSGLASSCYSNGKFRDINGGIWEEAFGKNEPQLSSWFVFRMQWMGLTFLGSPLIIPPPQFLRQAKME